MQTKGQDNYRGSRVSSASKRFVSGPVQKIRDENHQENQQKQINIESMSFSYDAGPGANEDVSIIDIIKDVPVSPNKSHDQIQKPNDTESSLSIHMSDEENNQDPSTDRPLFNSGLEKTINKSALSKKISMRKDFINNIAGKVLEEVEKQLQSRVTRKEKINYESRRSKNYEDQDSEGQSEDESKSIKTNYLKTQSIEYKDSDGKTVRLRSNPMLKPYSKIFTNLLQQCQVRTMYPIQTMVISADSSRAITVTKADENESWIKMYSMQTQQLTFEERIGGGVDQYIKVKEVEQNPNNKHYAVVYSDDGKFRLRVFGKETRNKHEIEQTEVKINEILGIDDYTMVNDDFADPFITCCWISETCIFINFFHSHTLTHHHFVWSTTMKKVIGVPQFDDEGVRMHHDKSITHVLDCNLYNFPQKCFYNEEKNQVYAFYRQGHSFTLSPTPEKIQNYRYQRIIDLDLGQMALIFGEALAVRSSGKVLFFKQVWNYDDEVYQWVQYHDIKVRGFIYFIKGNVRIQITTDTLIYFYIINRDTLVPELENVMYNFMNCNQMMIGSMRRYGISYKQNEMCFAIYTRKYMHNLRVCVDEHDYSGSKGIEIPSSNLTLVSKIDKLMLLDSKTYNILGQVPIPLLETDSREPNEIIGMCSSQCQNYIAVVTGKNLVMKEQKQNQLFVFRKTVGVVPQSTNTERAESHKSAPIPVSNYFELIKRVRVKELPIFSKVTMQFFFKDKVMGNEPTTLIFCKRDCIFSYNFVREEVVVIYQFQHELSNQPDFFNMDHTQNLALITDENDSLWINLREKKEVDMDMLYGIGIIKATFYDFEDEEFYLLCNFRHDQVGFYIVKFQASNPNNYGFMTRWSHKLWIGDADIHISRGIDQSNHNIAYKELIVSYKSDSINTYNIVVLDLSAANLDSKAKNTSQQSLSLSILHKYECFQLWESQVSGLLMSKTKDFLSFSKDGINVVAFGSIAKRPLVDFAGHNKIIHSVDSLSFLKVDPLNYLSCRCQDYNNRIISIEQEWIQSEKDQDSQNQYEDLYKIKLHEITLRELLILQSIYVTETTTQIHELIGMQPDPRFFYKSFLELDGSNMVSILAFDSNSVSKLLHEKNSHLFSEDYPILYKVKASKRKGNDYYYTNAIDNALKFNQVEGVKFMINYIIKFQNNFISSYLFLNNLPIMIQKGVMLEGLLNSKVFNMRIDFNGWPGNHTNLENCIRPYNGSFFQIRHMYREVFPEPEYEPLEHTGKTYGSSEDKIDYRKIYKIKYSVNLLPQIGQHFHIDGKSQTFMNSDVKLMELCAEGDELEMFDTETLSQVIQYKWENNGLRHHLIGCVMHLINSFLIVFYIYFSYYSEPKEDNVIILLLAIGITYPAGYEVFQVLKIGVAGYLRDTWNYADMIYVSLSLTNIYFQVQEGPYHIASRAIMCLIVLQIVNKTFFFLRIFPSLTPIVVMITSVIYDLRIFMFFYFIMISFFCLLYAVIGLGQPQQNAIDFENGIDPSGVAKEYQSVGLLVGEFMWTFRMSMGDFSAIGAQKTLTKIESKIFWLLWLTTVIMTCIIFLNFVVAEACASYSKVKEYLGPVIEREKAVLISESEEMQMNCMRNKIKYPKYLIVRETEN